MSSDSFVFASKGKAREAGLGRDEYFSDGYFSLDQLCSFAHQINLLHSFEPRSLLEVGMGNGFTSSYLKNSGIDVTTVDINHQLNPDICCDLQNLASKLSSSFDVVSCCEVLEHMPWRDFETNISILRRFSKNLFLTLPYGKRIIGVGGFTKLRRNKTLGLWLPIPFIKKPLSSSHFWELDYTRETSTKAVISVLLKYYNEVQHGVFQLNPYHRYFHCRA